jgi:hypothetical protein
MIPGAGQSVATPHLTGTVREWGATRRARQSTTLGVAHWWCRDVEKKETMMDVFFSPVI